jgi:glycosyltransferase involved in cell wall biosynthesis
MPVYNGEAFIREALDSLLAQTFGEFELVIADNASTDGTEAIARAYELRDARIRYVRHSKNAGPTANFRFVLNQSQGEYFMWAAADDLWAPSFIARLKDALERDKAASFAMSRYVGLSMLHPMFGRGFGDVLDCIEIVDRNARVLEFARKPFRTHKDNLLYSLWRREFLTRLADDSELRPGCTELALYRSRGVYVRDVLFSKRYPKVVPGHWVEPFTEVVARYVNRLRRRSSRASSTMTSRKYIDELAMLMDTVGFERDLAAEVIALNNAHCRSSGRR